ncbi:MAG: SDR family NAD(P)-dependent oxidoreductase [Myxococcales bacterium]|nr:SDR family NAD(P)-dependent oxidoreductase [Myxococcales bacterium]
MNPWTLSGRYCVITGASAGIGRATAKGLSKAGAKLILLGRSPARTEAVVNEVRAAGGQAWYVPLDLASLDSVRAAIEGVKAMTDEVAVLINNAGLAGIRGITTDGFELAFGVNHLGHYLLTRELIPVLSKGSSARIIHVASKAHLDADGIDWSVLRKKTQTITGIVEYQRAKLCNVLFAKALSRRLPPSIVSYSVHPGVVASNIWRPIPWPIRWYMKRGMRTLEAGAEGSIRLATDPAEVAPSGSYFHRLAVEAHNPIADDIQLQEQLWSESAAWTGLPTEYSRNPLG